MKKKILLIMLCLTACVACALGFSACNLFSDEDESQNSEHTHTIQYHQAKDATCTADGNKEYWYCNSCGDYFLDEKGENKIAFADTKIAATGHTVAVDAAVAKTCEKDGLTEGKHCSVCDAVIVAQQKIPAGHVEVIDKAQEATCEKDGLTQGKHCTICNIVTLKQEVVPAHHTLVEDKGVDATCTQDGTTGGKHCEKCSYTVPPEKIPAKGHSEVVDSGKAATCTEAGLTDGKHCSVCNTVTVTQQTVAAKGHTSVADAAVAATCKKDGLTAGSHCSVCKAVIVKQEAVKGEHKFVNSVCSVCGVHSASNGLVYTLNADKKSYSVSGIGTCTDTTVYIADVYEGLPVTAVAEKAFASCFNIVKVVIPEGVTAIEDEAFDRCMAMTEVSIPSTVKSVGFRAFNVCNALESVKYAGSADEWNAIDIDDNDTYLSNSGAKVGNYSLVNASKVYGAVNDEPHYHTYDYKPNFDGNPAEGHTGKCLTCDDETGVEPHVYESYVINESGKSELCVNYMSDSTYHWKVCLSCGWTDISEPHVYLGGECVCGTTTEKAELEFELSEDKSYYVCTGIGTATDANLAIPAEHNGKPVKEIGSQAFESCKGLTGVTIPNGVTNIGDYAFDGCEDLVSVTLPDSLTSIGEYVFNECNKLQYSEYGNGLYLGNSGNQYLVLVKAKNENVTSCSVNANAKLIAGRALENCQKIKTLTIGEKVTFIGEKAFYGCWEITGVTIPASVTHIGEGAFGVCYKLSTLTVDAGNTKYRSAGNCIIETATKTLVVGCKDSVIPDDGSVTAIGKCAFQDCWNLTSIVIPSGVTEIGDYAFARCLALTSVTIPASVTSVGVQAFFACEKLASLTFKGTQAQWSDVVKGYGWDQNQGNGKDGNLKVNCAN